MLLAGFASAGQRRPLEGAVIVVETTKGSFAFDIYPIEAPVTVAHVVALVRSGFYDGQRVHRAILGFVAQRGDPRSRDLDREAEWDRGDVITKMYVRD